MNALLDHNVPEELRHEFPEDWTVHTAKYQSLDGVEDGELLSDAQDDFALLVTQDEGIPYQQNLSDFDIDVVIMDVEPAFPEVMAEAIPEVVGAGEQIVDDESANFVEVLFDEKKSVPTIQWNTLAPRQ